MPEPLAWGRMGRGLMHTWSGGVTRLGAGALGARLQAEASDITWEPRPWTHPG